MTLVNNLLIFPNRVALQKYFYPPMFRNQRKTDLSGVSDRVHEEFVVKIVFEGETTWRVPTQEQSKDWRFPKDNLPELQMSNGPKTTGRPYGWLDIKCSEGSNVEWALPLMNDEHGYVSKVAVSFANVEITTSVNYSTLLSAPNVKVGRYRTVRLIKLPSFTLTFSEITG